MGQNADEKGAYNVALFVAILDRHTCYCPPIPSLIFHILGNHSDFPCLESQLELDIHQILDTLQDVRGPIWSD